MDKFIKIVDRISQYANAMDILKKSGIVVSHVTGERSFIESHKDQIIAMLDIIYNIGKNPDTGNRILDAFLNDILTKTTIRIQGYHSVVILDIKKAYQTNTRCGWYAHCIESLNNDGSLLSIFNEALSILNYVTNPELFNDISIDLELRSFKYSFYPALTISEEYYFHKEKHQLEIDEFNHKLSIVYDKYLRLKQEVDSIKNRIAIAIPEFVIYNYDEIKTHIDPFRHELLITQRIFARNIKIRSNLPVAEIVSK